MCEDIISGMPVKSRCSADLALIFLNTEIDKYVWDKHIFAYLYFYVSIYLGS